MGIMLVYDITNEKTFENIKHWIRNIDEHAAHDVERMIIGNKCDLDDNRKVPKQRGEMLAVEFGIKFMETSAKSSTNVEDAFYELARDIKNKMDKSSIRMNSYSAKPERINRLDAPEKKERKTSFCRFF